ncbi:hypothetical protein [Bradyrhizobium sp. ARR65]|uniref:hypothetical protein n=1 Tax=Bradyrhizobium sp. ARR65 TaxID=1040989 RepID=UPI0018DC1CE4|nr:hypothetical protein [Bradyrhizobium sp. ARR65]
MRNDKRLLDFDRRDIGAAANDDVLLAAHEQQLTVRAALHQIPGMIPAAPHALRRRLPIVPVAGEQICAVQQKLANLAVGDVLAMLVNQPDLRVLPYPRHAARPETETQIAYGFRRGPDIVKRRAELGRDLLLQFDRAGIAHRQAAPQSFQAARLRALAIEQGCVLRGKAEVPCALVALDRIQNLVGVETLQQHEDGAELYVAQEADQPAHVRQRQRHGDDVIPGDFPVRDELVHGSAERCRRMNDEFGFAGGSRRGDKHRGFVHSTGSRRTIVAGAVEQTFPWQAVIVCRGCADNEALVPPQDNLIGSSDVVVSLRLANVECRPQPLQERCEFGEFECGSERRRDRSQVKTGIIGNNKFRPVHHVKHHAIARPDAACRHSARNRFGFAEDPLVGPGLLVKDESCAPGSGLRLRHQSVEWG